MIKINALMHIFAKEGNTDTHVLEVIRADLMAALLQSGCTALRSVAAAETCGHDIDVPESKWYLTTLLSAGTFNGEDASLHAASILSPGAVTSGCKYNKFN